MEWQMPSKILMRPSDDKNIRHQGLMVQNELKTMDSSGQGPAMRAIAKQASGHPVLKISERSERSRIQC